MAEHGLVVLLADGAQAPVAANDGVSIHDYLRSPLAARRPPSRATIGAAVCRLVSDSPARNHRFDAGR
jgi:hypothetical protein